MSLFSSHRAQFHTSIPCKVGVALAMALSCGPFSTGALAQGLGVVVNDPKSIWQQGLSYARQFEQLQQETQTLQNILMQAQSLGTNINLFGGQLQKITDSDSIIQSACPGAGAGLVGSLLNSLTSALSPNQPIATRQQMICAQIVIFQIDEYNKTADALNAIGGTSTTTLEKLNSLIASVDTLGKTTNAQAQAAGVNATVVTAMATWQTQIRADEAVIQALKQQQAILATVAMKGNNTLLGNVVQAAALKAAFTINQ